MSDQRTQGYRNVLDAIQRLVREKYNDDKEFHRQAVGDRMAYFTVRRCFDHRQRPPSYETLMLLAQAAGFRPDEIRQMLIDAGDHYLYRMIGSSNDITSRERALIEAARKLDDWPRLAGQLDLLAAAAGVDIKAEIKNMR